MAVIALAGRPNVGKSSLFNRMLGKRKALVWDRAGITRDVLHAKWRAPDDREVDLWDMAGWDKFGISIKNMEPELLSRISLVVAVVDGSEPLTGDDRDGFNTLRRLGIPVIVAINKSDKRSFENHSNEIYEIFQGKAIPIAAETAAGVAELEDAILEELKKLPAEKQDTPNLRDKDAKRVLILGRPNVGKSSFMNRIAGETISLVSEVAGTTRDTVEYQLKREGRTWLVKDSAGVRKKGKVFGRKADPVEIFSVQFALKSMKHADFGIFIIEANEQAKLHSQDKKLLHLLRSSLIPSVILVNKWDLFKKRHDEDEYRDEIKSQLGDLGFVPILFVSAKTGFHIEKVWQMLREMDSRLKPISTNKVNTWLQKLLEIRAPRVAKKGTTTRHGKTQTQYLNFTYAVHTSVRPMSFQIFCNAPYAVGDDDRRYYESQIREEFHLQGIPVRLVFRKKTSRPARGGSLKSGHV